MPNLQICLRKFRIQESLGYYVIQLRQPRTACLYSQSSEILHLRPSSVSVADGELNLAGTQRQQQLPHFPGSQRFMIDRARNEFSAIQQLGRLYILCRFHVLQEWERSLKMSITGVSDIAQRTAILRAQAAQSSFPSRGWADLQAWGSNTFRDYQPNQEYSSLLQQQLAKRKLALGSVWIPWGEGAWKLYK